jgi:hypothetical protein
LEETKNKILSDIQNLSDDAKKTLKYVESLGRGVKINELITKCFLLKNGGSTRDKASKAFMELGSAEIIRKDKGGANYPRLKDRITELLSNHKATEQEMNQVYNHILMELL